MTDNPAIDPLDAFLWQFSSLHKTDPEGRQSGEIAKRIHLALSTDEMIIVEEACREALTNCQPRLIGSDREQS
jgi:hypothetical protein